jgi:hypothetical protein
MSLLLFCLHLKLRPASDEDHALKSEPAAPVQKLGIKSASAPLTAAYALGAHHPG